MDNSNRLEPAVDRAGKWFALLLAVLALGIYLPTIATDLVNTDNQAASASAWRIATTGRPWMEGVDTAQLEGTSYPDMWIVPGADGHLVHNRTAAVVIAAVPFYWTLNNDADPENFHVWVGGVAAAVLTSAAGALIFLTFHRLTGLRSALAGAAVFLFATPTWSVSANALWTHSVTELALAGAAWALSRNRWLFAGLFLGLGILARPHIALIAAVVGLGMAWSRRSPRLAVLVALPTAACLGLLMLWNRLVFGKWNIRGGYSDYVVRNAAEGASGSGLTSSLTNYAGFLVAPDRGLFLWSPIIVFLLPALMRSWKGLPDWTRWLIGGGLAYTFLQLRINSFLGGSGYYGYRHGLELLVCMSPALMLSFRSLRRTGRILAGPIVGLQFGAIALGATTEGFFVLPEAAWRDNGLWLAMRDQPFAVGPFIGLCVIAGLAVSVWSTRAGRPAQQAETSDVSVWESDAI